MSSNKERHITSESYGSPHAVRAYEAEDLKWTEKTIFEDFFSDPGKILDLGCGVGRTSIALKRMGHEVSAIDYSEAMIARAKEKYAGAGIHFSVMDAQGLDFPDGVFDYAFFSFNGLDYLYPESARLTALKEIRRVLKSDGIFAFSSHNGRFIPDSLFRISKTLKSAMGYAPAPYRWDYQDFGRLITYFIHPKKQIEQLIAAGFHDIRVISKYGKNARTVMFKDPYPSYVAMKGASI